MQSFEDRTGGIERSLHELFAHAHLIGHCRPVHKVCLSRGAGQFWQAKPASSRAANLHMLHSGVYFIWPHAPPSAVRCPQGDTFLVKGSPHVEFQVVETAPADYCLVTNETGKLGWLPDCVEPKDALPKPTFSCRPTVSATVAAHCALNSALLVAEIIFNGEPLRRGNEHQQDQVGFLKFWQFLSAC